MGDRGDCSGATACSRAQQPQPVPNIRSVYLASDAGTRIDHLHMSSVQVKVGDRVTAGARIGKVSNVFNGTPTTIHLHINLFQNVTGRGWTYVPPYTSLVSAYQAFQLEIRR